jgi:hypothetical protein
MAQMGLITRRSTKVSWRCPVSGDPDRGPPTLSSATSDARLGKPCVTCPYKRPYNSGTIRFRPVPSASTT